MIDKMKLDEYDRRKLVKARKLITEVYEYNYGDSHLRKQVDRLETIIRKLEALEQM